MKNVFGRQNRQLLFRFYLIIVGGLITIAIVLDFSFSRLQDSLEPTPDQWIEGHLRLIEAQLAELPQAQWPLVVADLEAQLGFPVRILPTDNVVHTGEAAGGTQEVFDDEGRSSFFRHSPTLDAGIQIGPVATNGSSENVLLRFIPPLFYLSIFVFVGLWLRPLLRDLNLITNSARDFAEDYRRPVKTLDNTTSLRELAANFDDMSSRIRGLIQGQKELTSALSHEMRTPLARIRFAMAVIGDKNKADIGEELESIEQDVREIDQLIGTMLDYARLDHPDMEMNWQLTPADEWLEQTASKCRILVHELRVENELTSRIVRMDPHLMELALSNLLVNACRYARSLVRLRFTRTGTRFQLCVEDDGQGIPAADREAIFKAFTRLDNSRNRETGGYGLGLAIVARIATLHGGSALAEQSELGGARIVIVWPKDSETS